jgi:hypothetical protein
MHELPRGVWVEYHGDMDTNPLGGIGCEFCHYFVPFVHAPSHIRRHVNAGHQRLTNPPPVKLKTCNSKDFPEKPDGKESY